MEVLKTIFREGSDALNVFLPLIRDMLADGCAGREDFKCGHGHAHTQHREGEKVTISCETMLALWPRRTKWRPLSGAQCGEGRGKASAEEARRAGPGGLGMRSHVLMPRRRNYVGCKINNWCKMLIISILLFKVSPVFGNPQFRAFDPLLNPPEATAL